MRGSSLTPLAVVTALLVAAPSAHAALRAQPLETSCAEGFTYGEHTFEEFTVEGCSRGGEAQGDETVRRRFRGELEVNGMLLVPAAVGVELTATVTRSSSDGTTTTTARLERDRSTHIVVDPLIGGSRRRITLYTGTIDLSVSDGLVRENRPGSGIGARAAFVSSEQLELPLSGSPSLLGLRVQDSALDATLTRSSLSFDVALSLGSGAPALLRDWVDETVGVELVDGQGMTITDLTLRLPDIAIAGIGGLENFKISYDGGRDVWSGTIKLDLGTLFPVLDFETEVSAANGSVLYIRAAVSNLSIPIGATGITLDAVAAEFGLDPLKVGAGVGVTAGPRIAGAAVIDADGELEIELEPSFRLEATGTVRILPAGSGQLARGDIEFIYDADGLISLSGDARYDVTISGIGIGADIGGSGAYATDRNQFNIEAHATGELLLGVIGDFEVVRLEAVVSSDGWGTCGELGGGLLSWITGGIGQQWGGPLEAFTGCDLTPFSDPVAGASIAQRRPDVRSRTFRVASGTKKLAIEVRTDTPGARVRLLAPGGAQRLQTDGAGRKMVDAGAAYFASDRHAQQVIFLRNPKPGTWTVQWVAGEPQVVGLRTARDAAPLRARATVARRRGNRPGVRHLRIGEVSGLSAGERLRVGIQTARGVVPIGIVAQQRRPVRLTFAERGTGTRRIVAQLVRDGVPIPGRRAVIGRYRATLPGRPARIDVRRRGRRLEIAARAAAGAEQPQSWHYVLSTGRRLRASATNSGAVRFAIPRRARSVTVAVRPVLGGRVLAVTPRTRTLRLR